MGPGLPIRVQIFTAFVALTGLALLGFLIAGEELYRGVLAGTAFFIIQIVITGSYPLPAAPRAKTDVSTAALLGGALVLEPGIALAIAVAGNLFFYLRLKHLGYWPNPSVIGSMPGFSYSFTSYTLLSGRFKQQCLDH